MKLRSAAGGTWTQAQQPLAALERVIFLLLPFMPRIHVRLKAFLGFFVLRCSTSCCSLSVFGCLWYNLAACRAKSAGPGIFSPYTLLCFMPTSNASFKARTLSWRGCVAETRIGFLLGRCIRYKWYVSYTALALPRPCEMNEPTVVPVALPRACKKKWQLGSGGKRRRSAPSKAHKLERLDS